MLALIVQWEPWLGITVNLLKSSCAAFDFAAKRPVDTSSIRYKDKPLPVLPPGQPFRYLGMLLTLTLDYSFEKARVMKETKDRVAMVIRAQFLSPSQRETVLHLAIVSLFRYTAGLIPWTCSELEELTREWVRGNRGAWGLDRKSTRLNSSH